jgi:hypothetical protein
MSKFSQIARGTRALKVIDLPLPDGVTAKCAVRPLLGSEEAAILTAARAYAKDRGVDDPRDGNPIYELGFWVHTLVHGCVDADDAAAPFFDGGVEQILGALDRDRIALMFEQQQAWQDECSPRVTSMTGDEYVAHILKIASSAEDADVPFDRWRPALLASFLRTTALQLVVALGDRLPSMLGSENVFAKSTN